MKNPPDQATATSFSSIPYQPSPPPKDSSPIILVGCGGIARRHLEGYRDAGLRVEALVDPRLSAADALRDEFYPAAKVYQDYREALRTAAGNVVDVTTHPDIRPSIIRDCLLARKHVLSQKPFVLDLAVGESLIELAERQRVLLAVNQNGRWAPHFAFMRNAVAAGHLGKTFAVRMSCDWDHTWVAGTPFEHVRDLLLYDYAIHWFDMVRCLLPGATAERVYATTGRAPGQQLMPDLLGQVLIDFDTAQASLTFDAMVRYGSEERTYVAGTKGVVKSCGTGNQDQQVTITSAEGVFQPQLQGKWFPDGFRGTMSELLWSIAENRRPSIDASDNLLSLELCFAALQSVRSGRAERPGTVRRLPT